ncbi:Vmc-like lipoprotein signal peptide domain-containing protein [Ureaplasma canigenitalium]|uniref:Vmc-like lipoprotein signal peptide domain-containing protein n=1 Tax=Ureaplasma canigenitalium TaxID=42092 RepID=UPI0004E2400C|nr:hypothetical protein [Ureaplasma canigenitalium]
MKLKTKKILQILAPIFVAVPVVATIAACTPGQKSKDVATPGGTTTPGGSETHKTAKRNIDLDFTKYGIPKYEGQVKTRTLLHPAAISENKLNAEGVFRFQLHHSPVEGVTGDWVAFATEVKSANDNTLVEPLSIKKATTKADETPGVEFKLIFHFDKEKLENGKYYTFIFIKADGSERVVFNDQNIQNSRDIFPSKYPA